MKAKSDALEIEGCPWVLKIKVGFKRDGKQCEAPADASIGGAERAVDLQHLLAALPTGVSIVSAQRAIDHKFEWTNEFYYAFICAIKSCRVLVWRDGYYNGAIKTRKTVQPVEVSTEEAWLHRSQQLRELYESLSGETGQLQARRPCAALSPEDLTESEWFYVMCLSFSFPPGVG